jgi:hypothetical protein
VQRFVLPAQRLPEWVVRSDSLWLATPEADMITDRFNKGQDRPPFPSRL